MEAKESVIDAVEEFLDSLESDENTQLLVEARQRVVEFSAQSSAKMV